jgi:hypothetical protein
VGDVAALLKTLALMWLAQSREMGSSARRERTAGERPRSVGSAARVPDRSGNFLGRFLPYL